MSGGISPVGPLVGRRLPDAMTGEPGPGWDAWKAKQPGDYMRVFNLKAEERERMESWYICDPLGNVGQIGGGRRRTIEQVADLTIPVEHPPIVHDWEITEHDDGTISVQPSIMDPGGWHGYLTHGVWTVA